MRKRPVAFTLLEVALVFSLITLLLVLMSMYLVRGQRLVAETDAYASVRTSSNLILRRISDELYRASHRYIHSETDGTIFLSYSPANDSDPFIGFEPLNGKITWRKWVGFFYDTDSHTIFRAEEPLAAPDSELMTKPLPDVDIPFFRSLPANRRQPIGSSVKSFQVSTSGNTVSISVTTSGEAPVSLIQDSDRAIEVTVSSVVSLLN